MLVIAIVNIEIILMVAVYCAVRTVLHTKSGSPTQLVFTRGSGNLTTLHLT